MTGRPPSMARGPDRFPLSRATGARPASAAMALRSTFPSSGSSAIRVAEHAGRRLQDFIDGRQFGIGISEPDHILLDLCDAAFKDGNQGLDIGTNIGVGGLLEPGVLLLAQIDELSPPDRLGLKGFFGPARAAQSTVD